MGDQLDVGANCNEAVIEAAVLKGRHDVVDNMVVRINKQQIDVVDVAESHNHSNFRCHEHDHVIETTGLAELFVDAFDDGIFEVIMIICDKILGCCHVECHDLSGLQ